MLHRFRHSSCSMCIDLQEFGSSPLSLPPLFLSSLPSLLFLCIFPSFISFSLFLSPVIFSFLEKTCPTVELEPASRLIAIFEGRDLGTSRPPFAKLSLGARTRAMGVAGHQQRRNRQRCEWVREQGSAERLDRRVRRAAGLKPGEQLLTGCRW